MPYGSDPYGSFAYQQRVDKERLATINAHKKKKEAASFPADPHGAYLVTNPLTHVDSVITPGAKTPGSAAPRLTPTVLKAVDGSKQSAAGSSRASVRSVASSSSRLSRGTSRCASSIARDEALLSKMEQLETTVKEERASRQKVEAELQRLEELVQKHLSEPRAREGQS